MLTFLMHEPFGIIHKMKFKCGGHGIWVGIKPPQGPVRFAYTEAAQQWPAEPKSMA